MLQVKVLVVSFQNLGVLQRPQPPTCLQNCLNWITNSTKHTIKYLIIASSYHVSN